MDATKWSQENNHEEIGLMMKPMEEMVRSSSCNNSSSTCTGGGRGAVNVGMERKAARPPEQLNCPRCNSTNTKFCYYNNYSLTQPRYFCKTCRRYWTEGGSLRNVPVGGGSRKNKRSSSSSSFSSLPQHQQPASSAANSSHHHHHHHAPPDPNVIPDLNPPVTNSINMNLPSSLHFSSSHHHSPDRIHKGQDLNLAFPAPAMQETHQAAMSQFLQINQKMENSNNNATTHHHHQDNNNSSSSPAQSHHLPNYDHHQFSAMEFLRTGMATRGPLSSFLPGQVIDSSNIALYNSSAGFSMHDYKPNLGFTIENGIANGRADNNSNGDGGGGGGRINFFPNFGEMKQINNSGASTDHEVDQHHQGNKGNSSAGEYWNNNNGVLGGGPW